LGKIDKLIDCASRGKLDILETLYHDDMKIYMSLSIDFVFEDDRWQITREVIFAI